MDKKTFIEKLQELLGRGKADVEVIVNERGEIESITDRL